MRIEYLFFTLDGRELHRLTGCSTDMTLHQAVLLSRTFTREDFNILLQLNQQTQSQSAKSNDASNSEYKSYTVGKELNQEQFDDLKYEVTDRMGDSEYLFMEDGTIGAAQWGSVVAKVLTDSADAALYFRNILNPYKFKQSGTQQEQTSAEAVRDEVQNTQLKIYVATSVNLEDSAIWT